jgi:FKBP-type peptidyl-prolyl cis-trans isomerase
MRLSAGPALATAVTMLVACGDSPTEVVFEVIEEVEFAASLGIDLADFTELASGVYIRDVELGTGDAFEVGGEATVNYTGWLRTGAEFDSGQFPFPTGTGGRPIVGFELGLDGTTVGGTRLMIIPPELAYGAGGAGPIPPGAIVIFEVELVSLSN